MHTKFNVITKYGNVECKTYTLKDQISILFSRNSYDSKLLKDAFNQVLEKCCSVSGKNKQTDELLLIHLIAKSNNQFNIKKEFVCDCGNSIDTELNIDRTVIDQDKDDIIYKLPKFNLILSWPKLWDDDNLPLMISKCIKYIEVGSEKIKIDELNDKEILDLNQSITEKDMLEIAKILTSPKQILALPIKCNECGKSHIAKIEGFKEFIDILL